jgi:hypothetical protein
MTSWYKLNDTYRAVVLKNNFQKYSEITGLFVGFQSFVLTLDIIDHTDYIPVLLMCTSFFFNMIVFFVSTISYTSIMGGMYEDYYSQVNSGCVYTILYTSLSYYVSLMWSLNSLFIESEITVYTYTQAVMMLVSVISVIGLMMYYSVNEKHKANTESEKRKRLIRCLNQLECQ